jgi:hypothetical protein
LWEVPAGAERVAALFARIGATAPNQEIGQAIIAVNDRLHPFRMIEPRIFEHIDGELEELILRDSGRIQAIRRFHVRRIRAVASLLRERLAA